MLFNRIKSKKSRLLVALLAAMALLSCGGGGKSGGGNASDGGNPSGGPHAPGGTDPGGDDGGDGEAPGDDSDEGGGNGDNDDGNDGSDPDNSKASHLARLGTVPLGAEVTGIFVTDEGDLFFNVQHPSGSNKATDSFGHTYHTGTVGVVTGVNINQLPATPVSVPVPETQQQRETVQLAYGKYQVLGQTGNTFGGALQQGLGSVIATDDSTVVITSNTPDFNGFIPTSANQGYLFTNWESNPGGMSRLKLIKNTESGLWSVDNTDVMMLDFGEWGTVANCFGSVSPWNTPLTSEEWGNSGDATHQWNDPNANHGQNQLASYIDPNANSAGDASQFPNTYRYHYIVEITQPAGSNPQPIKHYSMGRFEHEIAIVMPDQRTVYLSQDDTNGVLYKYVADKAADLSSGTLYAAKLTQDAGSADPATTGFAIEWVELANGSDAQIEIWIAQYDDIDHSDYVEGKSSYLTDADAIAWANGDSQFPSYDSIYEPATNAGFSGANTYGGAVTAGKPMDNRVAFLESRKAARAKGATAEWRKFEGIYINAKRAEEAVEGTDLIAGETVDSAYVYFAIADMDNGMIDGHGDIQLANSVKDCGGVYRMPLEAGYNTQRIEPVVMGAIRTSEVTGDIECDVEALSQPDNLIVLDDGRLIIGEDGMQTNNTLWLYQPATP